MELKKDIRRCRLKVSELWYGSRPTDTNGEFYVKLLESVRREGVSEPILVINLFRNYNVKVGNSRLWAARQLGIEELECIVVTLERDIGSVPIPEGREVENIHGEFTRPIHWVERSNYVALKCTHFHLGHEGVV